MRLIIIALSSGCLLGTVGTVQAQSFSCSFGEPACLDYGAKVCNSFAKCVAEDAVCFDSFTCDYRGFVCKSDYDEAVEEIEDKVRRYNILVDEFNGLKDDYSSLEHERDDLISQVTRLQGDYFILTNCLETSDTLEEAQDCAL